VKQLAIPTVAGAAVLYLLLNFLWLAAANSASVSEGSRPILKTLCLVGAVLVYVAAAILTAVREDESWPRKTAVNAGIAVAVGLVLIMISSALWRRGQFFHDSDPLQRLPSLTAIVLGVALLAALVAPLVGMVGRTVWRR